MKILSVNIVSFGKLQNVSQDFDSGLNVFKQHNGFGKTTLANFIRAMLYGLKNGSRAAKRDNQTLPAWANWNSNAQTGGSMVVEHNGEVYRIERFFGATAKQERLSVINDKTGKNVDILTSVGEYFLGLTAESYDRSAYIPQESVEITSNENFDAKLAGIVQNVNNFDAVKALVVSYQREIKPVQQRTSGVLPNLEDRRLQLMRQVYDRQRDANRQKEIDRRLVEINDEQDNLANLWQQYSTKADELNRKLAQSAPTEEQIACRNKVQQLEQKLLRFNNLPQDKASCDELARKIAETPDNNRVQRPVMLPLLIVGIVLAVLGIVLAAVFSNIITVGIVVAVLGAVAIVVSFFIKPPITTLMAGEKDGYISKYFALAQKYVSCEGLDYKAVQEALWQAYNSYTADLRELEVLKQNVVQPKFDIDELQNELTAVRAQLVDIREQRERLVREMGARTEERKTLNTDSLTVSEQLAQVEAQIAEAKHNYDIAGKVLELFAQASDNLSTSYLPKLCKRTNQLLANITKADDGSCYETVIDKNFSVQLRACGVTKPLDNFSRGLREITLLCFRIALSELLFDGNIPFLVVDDAFVNFDEANFLAATKLLKQMSQHTQIVYLTCHDRLGALK